MTAPILEVQNIEVVYNSVALVLKGVSLTLNPGGIVALLLTVSGGFRRAGMAR